MGGIGSGGHNRKSARVHKMQGTYRKDRHGPGTSHAPGGKMPSCPTWLHAEAKREWRRLAPKLHELGLLTELDRALFAAYCEAYAEVWRLTRAIDEHGFTQTTKRGTPRPQPEVAMRDKAMRRMVDFGKNFGMTPQTRERLLGHLETEPADAAPNPFMAAFGNRETSNTK